MKKYEVQIGSEKHQVIARSEKEAAARAKVQHFKQTRKQESIESIRPCL